MANDDGFSLPSESDPVLGRNGSPLGYLNLAADALSPSNMRGFAQPAIDTLTDTGLGLGRALSNGLNAITPSRDTVYRIFQGLEAAGAAGQGRTPLYMQQQEMEQQRQLRQQAIMQQAAQADEQKRQHDMQLFEKAMSSPRASLMMEALAKDQNYSLAKQAGQFKRVMKEADYGSMKTYQQLLPEDVQQRFIAGEMDDHELAGWADQVRESSKFNAKEQAKARFIQTALNTPPDKRDAYQAQLVEEHEAASELKRDDAALKRAQALKAMKDAERGPEDHSVLNRVHQADNGGKPFEQGTAQSMQAALDKYGKLYAEGRNSVLMATPPSGKEQADYYTTKGLDNLELEQAPSGLPEGQYRTGPYRHLDEKEKDALVQYKTAAKTVATMNNVANQLITAKNPLQAAKQWAELTAGAKSGKNGLAAAYLADRDAFSSRMARLVEVGVLTNTDVARWSDTFGSFGDTVQTLKAKQALFGEIQDETERLLRLRVGGKVITTKERSKLDQLLDKTNGHRSVDSDFELLMGGKK